MGAGGRARILSVGSPTFHPQPSALSLFRDDTRMWFSPHDLNLSTGDMNTKIVFTRNSPVRTVLVNETTGKELYKIETPYRFVGSVTRVFRCDPAAPPNPMPWLHCDANEPNEGNDSEERDLPAEVESDRHEREEGNESDGGVAGAVNTPPGGDSPLVGNEIARLYWKWFASARIVFEGKVRRRAEFMPVQGKLRG